MVRLKSDLIEILKTRAFLSFLSFLKIVDEYAAPRPYLDHWGMSQMS